MKARETQDMPKAQRQNIFHTLEKTRAVFLGKGTPKIRPEKYIGIRKGRRGGKSVLDRRKGPCRP